MNRGSDYRIDLRRYDLGLFFLAFALLCLKSNDALAHPQLWAEDAVLFLKDQMEQQGRRPLFLRIEDRILVDRLHLLER